MGLVIYVDIILFFKEDYSTITKKIEDYYTISSLLGKCLISYLGNKQKQLLRNCLYTYIWVGEKWLSFWMTYIDQGTDQLIDWLIIFDSGKWI